jgi:putative transposase
MARAWRIEYEGAYYHVLSRGNERRDIFCDTKDRRLFLETLGEVSERFNVDVFAYVLMSNHYHLLIKTNHPNLSKAMQWLGVTYTRRFSNRHSRSGHLFQGRFKSLIVENDAYVVELSCYIHRNPLRAGMVKRLMDYKWSSYPAYVHGRKGPSFLNTDLILSFFTGNRKAYRSKVEGYGGEEKRLWDDLRHGLILGSQQFVDWIRLEYISEKPHREMPQKKGLVGRIDMGLVLSKASELFGCDFETLKDRRRLYGKEKDIRDLLVYFFWEKGAYTNGEVGKVFGITYTAGSHIVNQVKRKLALGGKFEKRYELLKSQIKM